MAHEKTALDARNLQLVAISPDTPAKSRALADKYNIQFPLLSDPQHTLAKKYAGVSDNGFPTPALFIIKQDGSVYFEQVAEAKDDRIDAAGLLAIVDNMPGSVDHAALPSVLGYSQDFQLRLGLAGGVLNQDKTKASFGLDVTALYALGDYVAVGLQSGASGYPELRAHMSLLLRARLQYWRGIGELYLQAPVGAGYQGDIDSADSLGLHHGLALGTEIHSSPSRLAFVELSVERDRFGGDAGTTVTPTSVLLKLGYGWRF